MRVPSVVESGKKNHVILDCDYDISSESEGQQVDVKWFFRNDPEPFFQWLPGRAPQAKGNLFSNGRLDLTYEVEGGNRFQKHRALKIMRPTTELSGTYRCKVSSFLDEDFMQKEMIIYCKYIFDDKTCLNVNTTDYIHLCLIHLVFGIFIPCFYQNHICPSIADVIYQKYKNVNAGIGIDIAHMFNGCASILHIIENLTIASEAHILLCSHYWFFKGHLDNPIFIR